MTSPMEYLPIEKAEALAGKRLDRRRKYFLDDPLDNGEEEVCHWTSWLSPCSGCFEQGESGGEVYCGGYDPKRKMMIGAGCRECGYTGVKRRWWPHPVSVDTEASA